FRWRANTAQEWIPAVDLVCDERRGTWYSEGEGKGVTYLTANTTVLCFEAPTPRDPNLIYYAFSVLATVLFLYAAMIYYHWKTKKKYAEFDKKVRNWSKTIQSIKERPNTPDQSSDDMSRLTGTSASTKITDSSDMSMSTRTQSKKTRKRRSKTRNNVEKSRERKKKKRSRFVYLRPREFEDPEDWIMKSERESGKQKWEQWIGKKGGIVRDQAPPEVVQQRRAEHKAKKQREKEEEERADKEKEAKAKEVGSSPEKEDPIKERDRKRAEFADRFITLGDAPPPPPAEKKEEKPAEKKKDVVEIRKKIDPFQKEKKGRKMISKTDSILMNPEPEKKPEPEAEAIKTSRQ
ncbi:hypothetical protein PFISCL1PPCAC_12188, partial [Pristionchus fissidentatus]